MEPEEYRRKKLIDKFSGSYKGTQGGIFGKLTRDRILTNKGISKKGRPKNQFWYRQRENVRTSLIDLQLFIEAAGDSNVNQVVTKEALEPLVKALLWETVRTQSTEMYPESSQDLKIERTEIANLFIKAGFDYFSLVTHDLTLSHRRTIEEAIDLSNHLALRMRRETRGEDQ
jgi:hypothetical protein